MLRQEVAVQDMAGRYSDNDNWESSCPSDIPQADYTAEFLIKLIANLGFRPDHRLHSVIYGRLEAYRSDL